MSKINVIDKGGSDAQDQQGLLQGDALAADA